MVAEPLPTTSLSELRKAPHVSYSQIRSYLMCPMKFYHSYQAKTEPSHRPLALVLGSAIHEGLAAYYGHLQGTGMKIAEDELLAVFRDRVDREWNAPIPIKLDEGDDVGELLDQGIGLLRMFHEQADCPQVLAVEQPFAVNLYDPQTGEVFAAPMIGAMDLVIQGPQRPMVVEHKTAARKYTREQLSYETQPSAYAYAAEQIGLGKVDLLYQLLIKNKTPSLQHCRVTRTPAHIAEMMETFASVVRAVDAGIFYRNRGWACADCTYSYRCNEGM